MIAYQIYASNASHPEKITNWLPLEGDAVKRNTNTRAKIKRLNDLANKLWV
jgi:hypothetical protein